MATKSSEEEEGEMDARKKTKVGRGIGFLLDLVIDIVRGYLKEMRREMVVF